MGKMCFKTFCRPWMQVSTVLNILQGCKMFRKDIAINYHIHALQTNFDYFTLESIEIQSLFFCNFKRMDMLELFNYFRHSLLFLLINATTFIRFTNCFKPQQFRHILLLCEKSDKSQLSK